MASFSASDAAFAGFAFVRRNPGAVIIWAIVLLVTTTGFTALVLDQFAPLLTQLATMPPQTGADPAKAMAMFRQILPFYGDALLFCLVFYPIVFAAMNRSVLRPKESAFGYFRLGGDELRQLGLMVSFIVLGIGAEIVVIILAAILAMILGLVMHAASHNDGLTLLSVVAVYIMVFAACIVGGVRLSLASAQTFATGRINIFGSWALTKGRFWPIFGAYVLATILAVIVTILGYIVIFALAAAVGGGEIMNGFMSAQKPTSTPFAMGSLLSAPRIIQLVLGAALSAITWPVVLLPAPTIYKAIVGDAPSSSM
jgi:hypothetical protein